MFPDCPYFSGGLKDRFHCIPSLQMHYYCLSRNSWCDASEINAINAAAGIIYTKNYKLADHTTTCMCKLDVFSSSYAIHPGLATKNNRHDDKLQGLDTS